MSTFSSALLAACLLITGIFVVYSLLGHNSHPCPLPTTEPTRPGYLWITGLAALLFFLLVSLWTVSRIYALDAPAYDFGIFSQMFYYMKQTGLPLTTLERDKLLSHFAVHFSPICYLLLPFYCLFPKPATLQILQAYVLTSAVIPLWKLGSRLGLSGKQRMLLCVLLLVFPAYIGGVSYDFHENCFLTPVLLWMFYGIVSQNTPLTVLSALLTLTVKEDGAIYVAAAALWLMVKALVQERNRKKLLLGLAMALGSILWFWGITAALAKYGDGVMNYRYMNFMYPGAQSLLTVVQSVVLHPMKLLYECTKPEKLGFIGLTLIPLLGLPLLTRRYERYLLLIPYVLVNLMSDYLHQHHIYYQYNFGSVAFLFFLTALNLADWKLSRQRTGALILSVAISLTCCGFWIAPKAMQAPAKLVGNGQKVQQIRSVLNQLPEEASITATSTYACYLSQRSTLYSLRYVPPEQLLSCEYVVLDPRSSAEFESYSSGTSEDGLFNFIQLLVSHGYENIETLDQCLLIYRNGQ